MIDFRIREVTIPAFLEQERVRWTRWIQRVAAVYGYRVGNVHYEFCTDEGELEVNRQFLGHDYYTDVITFDYSTPSTLSGDIFISMDRVRENAHLAQVSEEDVLRRIMIHGILHLTGQGDKTPASKIEMTRKEDLALQMW